MALRGNDIRYGGGPGWHVWTGQRWKVDADDAQVSRFAKRLASTYLQDAHMMEQAIVYAPDDYAADAMIKRAIRLRKFA